MPVKRKILENLSLPGGLFFHRDADHALGQRSISSRLNRVIRKVLAVVTPAYAIALNSGALESTRASAKLIRDNSSLAVLIFYVTQQPVIRVTVSFMTTLLR